MKFQQEFIANSSQAEKDVIFRSHWDEIALNKTDIALNPDYERYEQLETAGILKIFTARENVCKHTNRTVVAGYFVCFVMPHLHYKDHLFATNDILYLKPEYRQGFTALGLIRFAEKCLAEDGVSVVQINTKAHKSFDPLLERMGYTLNDRVYGKLIKKGN